jgi:Tol biopolymer transport system component
MLLGALLTACQQPPRIHSTDNPQAPISNTPVSHAESSNPLPTHTAAHTPIPSQNYQLMYVSDCDDQSDCVYAINVGCLESKQICLGEPRKLFRVSRQSDEPRPPIVQSSWSPDGQKVVIEAVGVSDRTDIFIGDWDGKNWVNLTKSPNIEGYPSWSPDSQKIAYMKKSGEDPYYITQAFSINLVDNKVTQLLSKLAFSDVGDLFWSPNQEKVVFSHFDHEGYLQIFIANPDGTSPVQLTERSASQGLFGFSPDGQWIMYTRETNQGFVDETIYRIRPDGSDEFKVTQDITGFKTHLAWSPVGNWIAFASNVDGNYDIYLIQSDGSRLLKVTQSDNDEASPGWRVVVSP